MYPLNNEHATLIRNILHNERLRYQAIEGDGAYIRTVTEAIDRMEHPNKYFPT
jgi:hypothetical protein